ncbi:PP2C-like domain-containing protein CG9801 isoform X1 [Centruroides vittatus]|uniref:PP2C-like domain-containing protein CG9801 isoform X1 n=1 Tax=Centruroides vittatus TaxID=120091 RepID=UPI00350ECDA1
MMPTLREKVQEFLKHLSSNQDGKCDKSPCTSPTGQGSFIHKYLCGEVKKNHPDILFGKSCYDLPIQEISVLSKKVLAAYTGPVGGLTQVNKKQRAFDSSEPDVDFIDEDYVASCDNIPNLIKDDDKLSQKIGTPKKSNESKSNSEISVNGDCLSSQTSDEKNYFPDDNEEIAGIKNWNRPSDYAYGIATTLYECHPVTRENAGDPIADSFAVCMRENSAILALADGVNWGEKSCLAARCAVHGCMDYLNKALYREGGTIETTLDIFVCLLRSFHAAHNLILQENGMLTTLCAAVVCQLKNSDKYIVCTCNVGDSLAYVYSQKYGVREITQGSHDIYSMRDMRDALGALGPVDGQNPELNNLTVSMTLVDVGDIVFLTSDGISDNFDPVVGKFAIPRKLEKTSKSEVSEENGKRSSRLHRLNSQNDKDCISFDPSLPLVEAHQRHELTLLRMEDLLTNGVNEGDDPAQNARQVCEQMIDFAVKLTVAKRRILEDPELYSEGDLAISLAEQRLRRRKAGEKLAMVPGKLDHASVVAYMISS